MTRLFDGIGALLSDVFGAPITILPASGAPYSVQGVFRLEPIEVGDDQGRAVLITAPTLKVQKDLAPSLAAGDRIAPSETPGDLYEIINLLSSGSPAADGFLVCELMRAEAGN